MLRCVNLPIAFGLFRKRYDRAEKEFIEAKTDLHRKSEAKDLLTEHLYTVIHQNELRKGQKLAELTRKLELEEMSENSDNSPGIELEQAANVIIPVPLCLSTSPSIRHNFAMGILHGKHSAGDNSPGIKATSAGNTQAEVSVSNSVDSSAVEKLEEHTTVTIVNSVTSSSSVVNSISISSAHSVSTSNSIQTQPTPVTSSNMAATVGNCSSNQLQTSALSENCDLQTVGTTPNGGSVLPEKSLSVVEHQQKP